MYLQSSVQFRSGNFVGRNEEATLYKGIVVFMIGSLKKSIPLVVKSSPDITITREWLKSEMDECLYIFFFLKKAGFYFRADFVFLLFFLVTVLYLKSSFIIRSLPYGS